MSVSGLVTGARHEPVGSELTADAAVTDEVLAVEWAELFTDEGGTLVLNDAQLDYLVADDEADTITLADPLADAAVAGDMVYVFEGGQVKTEYVLVVDMGEGDPVLVPIPFEQRDMWPNGDYDDPVPVVLTDDLTALAEVPQRTPARDPGFIRTGYFRADFEGTFGDPDGAHVIIKGEPAIEAYNAANEQTVNIDGEDNYMLGTTATAADGPRVEQGSGPVGGLDTEETRYYTGHADEITPAKVASRVGSSLGEFYSQLYLESATWTGAPFNPTIFLSTQSNSTGVIKSAIQLDSAQIIYVGATEDLTLYGGDDVTVEAVDDLTLTAPNVIVSGGVLDATMGAGSVGTGTFRDSVDARVTAGAPGAVPAASETVAGKAELATQAETNTGTDDARIVTPLKFQTRMAAYAQPLHAILTDLVTQTIAADTLVYGDGANSFATTGLSAFIRTLLDDATAAAALTTLGARPELEAIESQTGATYTLDSGDPNKVIQFSRTSPDTTVVTFPQDSDATIAVGATGKLRQLGTGGVSFVAGAGATLNSPGGLLNISARYGTVTWHKRAANTFVLSGHLA